MKFVSVTSSIPQVRSQPALRSLESGFQKDINSLLEHIELPFPTFQFIKPSSQQSLESQTFFAWKRPAHLRSLFLYLNEAFPPVLFDSRDKKRKHSFRIPVARKKLQGIGPIVCEVYWDAHDQILWLVDVIWVKQEYIYQTKPFSERLKYLETVMYELLYDTTGYSDCSVKVPIFYSLHDIKSTSVDSTIAIEFQPESSGRRRFVYSEKNSKLVPQNDTKQPNQSSRQLHERPTQTKQNGQNGQNGQNEQRIKPSLRVHKQQYSFMDDSQLDESNETNESTGQHEQVQKPHEEQKQTNTIINLPRDAKSGKILMKAIKDTKSKLPDTYRLYSVDSSNNKTTDNGLAAIRNIVISFALRERTTNSEEILVKVIWYDSFKKYEIVEIVE